MFLKFKNSIKFILLFIIISVTYFSFSYASAADGTINSSNHSALLCINKACTTSTKINVGYFTDPLSSPDKINIHILDTNLTGYAWGESVGWISFNCANERMITGVWTPGVCNSGNGNFKVLNDGQGNLSGYAWGENAGWINFNSKKNCDVDNNGFLDNNTTCNGNNTTTTYADFNVKINSSGQFIGWAWSENYGWIKFDCSVENACVETDWRPASNDDDNGGSGGGASFCSLNPTNPLCIIPTFCTLNPTNPSCLIPTFCSLNPTDPSCITQPFCTLYPTDPTCQVPTFCTLNPTDPSCQAPTFCSLNPTDPLCITQPFCILHPTDPSCQAPTFCLLHPTDPTCIAQPFCTLHPTDPSCQTSPTSCPFHLTNITDLTDPTNLTCLIPLTKDVWSKALEFLKTPTGDIISKTIIAIGALTGLIISIATVLFANTLSLSELYLIPFRIWTLLLTAFGIKKRNVPWGTVYDSVTKQPLDPAYVILQDLDGKEVATSITDIDGRYGFLVPAGKYRIVANKTNYEFPSKKLSGKTQDELYHDLYFNEVIDVLEDGVITKNIPMDPLKFDWNEFAKKDQKLMKFFSRRDLWIAHISNILFTFGFLVTIIAVFVSPVSYNAIILAIYLLLYILKRTILKPRAFGRIKQKETKNPLSFAIIRVFFAGSDNEVINKVADKTGKYYCLIPNGKYYTKIENKNLDESYSLVHTSEPIEIKNGYINKKFEV